MALDPSQDSEAAGIDEATKWHLRIEKRKAQFEYFRHLATLSTATVLLMTAFADKVFEAAHWKPLMIVSLFSFLASIIGSVAWYTMAVGSFPIYKDHGKVETVSLVTAWLGFLIGMILLAVFAIGNF